jgi:cell division ATPase FtsA
MKEFVYHVLEEEKLPLIINKIKSSPDDQFVVFAKEKKNLMNFFDYCKKYQIPYSHLYSENTTIAFKNYNEKKSKVFFISDDLLEKKNIFIPVANQIIHYDIPTHPLTYQKRNEIIKNPKAVKFIHLYCIEKEYQDFKAIEVYFEKQISTGKVLQKDLKLPKIELKPQKKSKKTYPKNKVHSLESKKTYTSYPKKDTKQSIWSKIKNWFKRLFRNSK